MPLWLIYLLVRKSWRVSLLGILIFLSGSVFGNLANQAGNASLLKDIYFGSSASDPAEFTEFGGTVYFRATDSNGAELWKTDGTESDGTKWVRFPPPAPIFHLINFI